MPEPRAAARDLFDEPLPTPRAAARWRLAADWRARAGGRGGDALLAAIVPGDPLDLARLARERALERALVLDRGEVLREAFAEMGAASSAPAPSAPGGPAWFTRRVDAALARVARRIPGPDVAADLDRLAAPTGLAPGAARRVVHAHAHRGAAERRAFRALLLDRLPLDEAARTTGEDANSLARRVAATLAAVSRAAACARSGAGTSDTPGATQDGTRGGTSGLEAGVTASAAPDAAGGVKDAARVEPVLAALDDGALAPFAAALGRRLATASAALALLRVLDAARSAPPALEVALAALRVLERARLASAAEEALAHLIEPTLPGDSHVTLSAACRTPRRALAARLRALDPLARELGAPLDPLASRRARVTALLECLAALERPALELWRLRARYADLPARVAAAEAAVHGAPPAEVAALWLDAGEPGLALDHARGSMALLARAALDPGAPCVEGPPRRGGSRRAASRARDPRSATEHGASVLRVLRLAGGTAGLVHRDPADPIPSVAAVALDPLEREVWAGAAGGVARVAADGLDPDARWASVEPVRGPSGEAAALVRLEWRHGLLPSRAARAAHAADWGARLGVLHEPLPRLVEHVHEPAADHGEQREHAERCGGAAPAPLARAAREAVDALAVGLAQRRWRLLAVRRLTHAPSSGRVEIALEFIAEGGGAALVPRPVGEARGIALALAAGLPVDVGRDPARLAAHASPAASSSTAPCSDTATGAARRGAASGASPGTASSVGPGAAAAFTAGPGVTPCPGAASPPASPAASATTPAFTPACRPASGVVLPVGLRAGRGLTATLARGHAAFVLVLESPRRGDLGPRDAARLAERLVVLAPALDLADLEQRERRAGGPGLDRDARDPCHAELARAVRRAARGAGPAVVCGAAGAGRAAVARWVEHVRARRRAVLPDAPPGHLAARDPGSATRLLDAHPRELAARGALEVREAARLSARAVVLPPVLDARHRLPGQVQRRLPPAVEIDEAALAVLWRAHWPAGVHDLEATLMRLVDDRADRAGPVTEADVTDAIRGLGLAPVERLPSRAPAPHDLAAALWCTRTAGGRANKTRAAAWLGWDPETLRARLRDAGLDGVPAAARLLAGPAAPLPSP